VMTLLGQYASAQTPGVHNSAQPVEFVVGPSYVRIPTNFFILVRKGKQIGAIRLTKVLLDDNNNGQSTYESYFQGDGSGLLTKQNIAKRVGAIEIKPMRGIHAFAWQPGPNRLWVGPWWFGCLGPNLVNMSEHFSEEDTGYEFAPTSAQNISEIDTADRRLKWYRYDSDKSIRLEAPTLPK